jgi:hypothetical protein
MAAMGRWLLVLQGVELVMRMGARLVVLLVGMDWRGLRAAITGS